MRVLKRYSLDREERIEIARNTAAFLTKAGTVSFAYIYGSFSKEEGFNDIDLAVYIDESKVSNVFDAQLELGISLEREIGYPVDCRAFNLAPLSFRFSIITFGDLIFSRDEGRRVSFETMTRSRYFDFKPHADFYYEKIALGR